MLQTSATANEIINTVAAEVGIPPVADPYSSSDTNFLQLRYLLNTSINELLRRTDINWEFLLSEYIINTKKGDEGSYPLPDDFLRMINQTGWDRSNRNPLQPLSSQQWNYLKGRKLISETILVNFRLQNGTFNIYPSPVSHVFEISFEYLSKNCVLSSATDTRTPRVGTGGDRPLFDAFLLERLLKLKWLQAKGFDSNDAQDDVNSLFTHLVASDKPAPILNAGDGGFGTRFLTGNSVSDTDYGN